MLTCERCHAAIAAYVEPLEEGGTIALCDACGEQTHTTDRPCPDEGGWRDIKRCIRTALHATTQDAALDALARNDAEAFRHGLCDIMPRQEDTMERKDIDQMTIEELLVAAGSPAVTINTYLYVSTTGQVCAMEKADRASLPRDEHHPLGYAQRFLRATGSTGRPWQSA